MRRSHGYYSGGSRGIRAGKRTPITRKLKKLPVGAAVRIKVDPRQPCPLKLRYNNRVGKIVGLQGRAYVVELNDLGKTKKFVVSNDHLILV
ncbi:MAG: hypothetical protein ACP5O3_02345 [Candidatus Micrarchaeia archaeon]|jgi:ribosomal protein L21E